MIRDQPRRNSLVSVTALGVPSAQVVAHSLGTAMALGKTALDGRGVRNTVVDLENTCCPFSCRVESKRCRMEYATSSRSSLVRHHAQFLAGAGSQ